jgi:hypothetical protein
MPLLNWKRHIKAGQTTLAVARSHISIGMGIVKSVLMIGGTNMTNTIDEVETYIS